LFVSISQVIGCEDRLRSDLYCVEWGVKLYSNQPTTDGSRGSRVKKCDPLSFPVTINYTVH